MSNIYDTKVSHDTMVVDRMKLSRFLRLVSVQINFKLSFSSIVPTPSVSLFHGAHVLLMVIFSCVPQEFHTRNAFQKCAKNEN